MPRKLDSEGLWEYALRALAAHAHSAGGLREKLTRRAQRAGDVADVLRRLKDAGYLDDKRFAESFTAARLEDQGLGKARVYRELGKRHIAPAVARQAVEGAYRETDELELIRNFLERKYRGKDLAALLSEPKNLLAAYRKLRLAGFGPGSVLRVLKAYTREPDLLDSLEGADEETPE